MDENQIFIMTPNDKPIKIVYENNPITVTSEKYKLTLKEVLYEILNRNYNLRQSLTRQQIHVEKGKVRKGCYSDVINFLVKRGISEDYIWNEISQERERTIFSWQIKSYLNSGDFGVIINKVREG